MPINLQASIIDKFVFTKKFILFIFIEIIKFLLEKTLKRGCSISKRYTINLFKFFFLFLFFKKI